MIVKAAVRIEDLRQNKEIVIPCMRHCDVFYILKELGYKKDIDYKELEQGFLDEHDNFYNRVEAWHEAYKYRQLMMVDPNYHELFSEDLW
jgi:hypothetical protein